MEYPEQPISAARRRAYENPGRALGRARGTHTVAGILLGLMAAGIAVVTDWFLNPPVVYLVNIGALYVARYVFACMYAAGINIYWKRFADQGHPDEHDLVSDHRYINAGMATLAACLAVATLVVTHDSTPTWMSPRWVLFVGTAFIGAATAESFLSFTPLWFYINILRRLPQRNLNKDRAAADCDADQDNRGEPI